MSDDSTTSDEKSPDDKDTHDAICRDFLRNVCKRGKRCKFRHPMTEEGKVVAKLNYMFCHDFQNSGCRRHNCKFIHCTREEEDYYKQTGQLPVRVQQAAALGIGILPNELPLLKGEVPICKDYLKGECKRAGRCKYRHLTAAEYEYELRRNEKRGKPEVSQPYEQTATFATSLANGTTTTVEYDKYEYDISLKRKRLAFDEFDACLTFTNGYKKLATAPLTPADYRLIQEENALMRRKIEELKKQVSDLTATNEVLLEQNARYRANKPNGLTTLTLSPPIVTVSQVVTPTVTPAPAVARPAVQGAPAPPITHLASTVPLTLNASATELVVSPQALQTRLEEPDIGPQATLPPPAAAAMNPNVSLSIPNMVPVSLPVPVETMAPHVSIAVTSLPQPPMQAQCASTSSLQQGGVISAHTTPMVSYPIVSHPNTRMLDVQGPRMPTSSLTH